MTSGKVESLRKLHQQKKLDKRKVTCNEKHNCFVSADIELARTGGDFALVGTIGQPDAGEMAGDDYKLSGGFWPARPTLALCFVNFEHFARFAMYWLDSPCGPGDNWCQGADLDSSTDVGLSDLDELAYWWLADCPTDWPWQ